MQPLAIPLVDATHVLGVGRTTLYLLSQKGELETFTIGSRRMISIVALNNYLAKVDSATAAQLAHTGNTTLSPPATAAAVRDAESAA